MSAHYTASVPSNIAFIKYWGKRPAAQQWPANDSLSMTLDALQTRSSVRLSSSEDHTLEMNGRIYNRNDASFAKTFHQLDRLAVSFGFSAALAIQTRNSFPMGAGIASSASGLAALTIASLAAWTDSRSWQQLEEAGFSRHKLADLSRLGSGSACRSLYGGFVLWQTGSHPEQQHYGVFFEADHWPLRDTVVLFSDKHKATGSTEAHELASSSPLFGPRLSGLPERMQRVQAAIARRDMQELGPWLEAEALEMHAVIMTSDRPIHYLNAGALNFLQELRQARRAGQVQAWFTIDAGPNIHLIHEAAEHDRVKNWLKARFTDDQLLHDGVGQGPQFDFLSE